MNFLNKKVEGFKNSKAVCFYNKGLGLVKKVGVGNIVFLGVVGIFTIEQ